MPIKVKLFAAVRDAAGVDSISVEARTVADVMRGLCQALPSAERLIQRSRFAVNQTFVSLETPVDEQDEIAVIPPVSGG